MFEPQHDILALDGDFVTKPIVENAAGGSFIDLSFLDVSDMLNRMSK